MPTSLVNEREQGDTQFDEESGEGDTISVERERDLMLSANARQAVEEIDRALERMDNGTYGVCVPAGTAHRRRAARGDPVGRVLRGLQAACRAATPLARARPAPRWLAPSIVIGVVILDQLTKSWVVAALSDAPLSIIGDDVELRLTRNSGGAFSLFTNATVLLALLAIVLSVVLVRAVHKAQRPAHACVALSLVLGGALGNLTDRITRSPGLPARRGRRLRAGRLVPELQRGRLLRSRSVRSS